VVFTAILGLLIQIVILLFTAPQNADSLLTIRKAVVKGADLSTEATVF